MSSTCIVVTGASRGIGAGIATALAHAGLEVACLSRSGIKPSTAGLHEDVSSRLHAFSCDVTEQGSMQGAVEKVAALGLDITGLVNNAGLHLDAVTATASMEHYDQVMDTNARSVLLGAQAVYPYLSARKSGLIVNMGSFFDKLGVKRNLAYCASKAAVGAMTRCMAVEWASDGIRVIDVAPGYIHTDLNHAAMTEGPLRSYLERRIPGRLPGTADDVSRFVAALFTLNIQFLTGETIYLDGGQAVAH